MRKILVVYWYVLMMIFVPIIWLCIIPLYLAVFTFNLLIGFQITKPSDFVEDFDITEILPTNIERSVRKEVIRAFRGKR